MERRDPTRDNDSRSLDPSASPMQRKSGYHRGMIRDRACIPVSSLVFLIVAAALSVVAAPVQAKDKPQAAIPLCPDQTMSRLELAAPAQASYGPDENARLNPGKLRATIVVIPAGRVANFTFSAVAPKDENAVVIYDSEFQQLAERGTDPAKGFEPFRYPATVQPTDTIVLVSTWSKWRKRWSQSFVVVDAPAEGSWIWTIRAEEAAIISGDYRDMIVNLTCE